MPARQSRLVEEKRQVRVKHQPRFVTLDIAGLRSACVAGVGIVQLPHLMVRGELHRGELIEITPPEWSLPTETIHVVFASPRGMLLAVRTLIDFLVEEFKIMGDE